MVEQAAVVKSFVRRGGREGGRAESLVGGLED